MASFDSSAVEGELELEVSHIQMDGDEEASDKEDFREWVEEDEDAAMVKSLFSPTILPSIDELIDHDKIRFSFDLYEKVKELCTDDISYIKMINFIREFVLKHDTDNDDIIEVVKQLEPLLMSKVFIEGDKYMKPIIEDDALLFLFEEVFESVLQCESEEPPIRSSSAPPGVPNNTMIDAAASEEFEEQGKR